MTTPAVIPSNAEVSAESDDVRRAILGAMQRMLMGHPKRVTTGALSTSHLALEAGVGRHYLYQTHPDLRERFQYLRDESDTLTQNEEKSRSDSLKARAEIVRLVELQARTSARAENWKDLTETLERAINVLQEELRNEQLKSMRLQAKLGRTSGHLTNVTEIPIRQTEPG